MGPPVGGRRGRGSGFAACFTVTEWLCVYYLETAQDEKVVCVAAIPGEGNHITYRPFDSFLEEYRAVFAFDHCIRMEFQVSVGCMVRYLDGIVYHSFLQYSEQGIATS
ncbi:uncharacterized protein LOC131298505 [Rhododendron vialii]|uniref:uncharacterized protein LOC131298505 n=1 Tax=Rhododendron vialii TaxID=182163 RepID=UPI00265E969F|nr:uncharacterized protein LOC131298505 [Rhododendron vialii]